ncbi:hypothetical protein [Haladaptatus halobius]|uniref:hypothetical protein n=1 Tax=Haladaptatus halobius TaxID=2884875 RepID=UPI001D0ABCDD|nr:hypothetical protein [Haladaptatus halobius]
MRARTGFAVVLTSILVALSVLIVEPFLSYVLAAMLLGFVLYPAQRRLAPVVGQRVAAFALVCCSVALVVVPTDCSSEPRWNRSATSRPRRRSYRRFDRSKNCSGADSVSKSRSVRW